MKNSFGLVLAIILFVGLGCSMLNKKEEKIDTPTPAVLTESSPAGSDIKIPESPADDSAELSIQKYETIKNGMSYEEVAAILGSKGTESRTSKVGKIELKSYKWEGEKYKRIYVNFRDNKVTYKSQSGLSTPANAKNGSADLSTEKYEQIKLDMSYEDVVKIIGSEGEETSKSDSRASYNWKGANNSRIYATFSNNKLNSKQVSGLN